MNVCLAAIVELSSVYFRPAAWQMFYVALNMKMLKKFKRSVGSREPKSRKKPKKDPIDSEHSPLVQF